jgi:hypothetical protein
VRGRRLPSRSLVVGSVEPWTDEPSLYGYGDCRIRSVPSFPTRWLDDWCGEWQEREEPRMDFKTDAEYVERNLGARRST